MKHFFTNRPDRQNVRKLRKGRHRLFKPYGQNLGPELVINGGFAADTDWTKGTGWTIAAGVAAGAAGSASALTQGPAALIAGAVYRVVFTIVTITAGGVGPNIGSTLGTIETTLGVHTQDVIAGAGSAIIMDKSAAFVGTIDNISVREVRS